MAYLIGLVLVACFIFRVFLFFLRRSRVSFATMRRIDQMEGADFEAYLAVKFREKGYKVAFTPATGDQGADLIIEKRKRRIAVQAKRYEGKIGNSAVQEAIAGMAYYDCDHAMVITNSEFTPAAVKLAEKCNVELWDREMLRKKFHIAN